MSAGVHQHTHTSSLTTTNSNKQMDNDGDHNNPIYDSLEDDVEHLEQMISSRDTNFNAVSKEVWRDVVSPSSSISSINTSDSDEEDFSGYIFAGSYSCVAVSKQNNNFCDMKSLEEDSLNESRISLQEINMQIGVAEELVLTPNSRQKYNNKHLFTNLETIHEDKFLHTPPKKDGPSPRTNKMQPSNMFLERLERGD